MRIQEYSAKHCRILFLELSQIFSFLPHSFTSEGLTEKHLWLIFVVKQIILVRMRFILFEESAWIFSAIKNTISMWRQRAIVRMSRALMPNMNMPAFCERTRLLMMFDQLLANIHGEIVEHDRIEIFDQAGHDEIVTNVWMMTDCLNITWRNVFTWHAHQTIAYPRWW